jgi:hypothetical protein
VVVSVVRLGFSIDMGAQMKAAVLDENGVVVNLIVIDDQYDGDAVLIGDEFCDIGFVYCEGETPQFQDPKEPSDKYDSVRFVAGRAVFNADYFARHGVDFDFNAYLVQLENAIYATDEYLDTIL